MGYTTDFDGSVEIVPPLNEAEISYLTAFARTRRMHRENGPYFVKGEGDFGQGNGPDVIYDYNDPVSQPGLWCQWVPGDGGRCLEWDGGEKFYNAPEWMKYIITHFLTDSGQDLVAMMKADDRFKEFTFRHVVNGVISAQGEDPDDSWDLVVTDNRVTYVPYVTVPGQEREV